MRAHHHISIDSVTQVYGDRTVFVDLSLVAAPFRRAVLETLHDSVSSGSVVTLSTRAAAT